MKLPTPVIAVVAALATLVVLTVLTRSHTPPPASPAPVAQSADAIDPVDAVDTDGDGFTDSEELRYLRYYFNEKDLTAQDGLYEQYLHDKARPAIARDAFARLHRQTVTVEVTGKGHVWLGDADVSEGKQKDWEFAVADITCSDPTSVRPNGCGENMIKLLAVPEPEWVFLGWTTSFSLEEPDAEITVPVKLCRLALAKFEERKGLNELNLVSDLGRFLVRADIYSEPNQVYNLDFDRGETRDDARGASYVGDGIPDAAEFALLDKVLHCPALNLVDSGGVASQFAWRYFSKNRDQAAVDLAGQEQYVQNVVAAYMTIGSFQHQPMIKAWVAQLFGVNLSGAQYETAGQTWFSHDANADNDLALNVEEWRMVVNKAISNEEKIREYCERALDPDVAGSVENY